MEIDFQPLGDSGVRLSFGNEISKEINQSIRIFTNYLKDYSIQGVIEWIPTYTSLAIFYNPELIKYNELIEKLKEMKNNLREAEIPASLVFEIPTFYGEETGPDLSYIAKHNGLSEEEVVKIHTSSDYLIYMIGFAPGFPYLGGMSKKIAAPRLDSPRAKIKAGSVGIAGEQTGIYPIETPGGWRIIGITPLKLYDPNRKEPILLSAGNYLRFRSISFEEFKEIKIQVENNTYKVKTYLKKE